MLGIHAEPTEEASSDQQSLINAKSRSRRAATLKRPLYTETATDSEGSDSDTAQSSDTESIDKLFPSVELNVPTALSRASRVQHPSSKVLSRGTLGRLTQDAELASGSILSEQLCASGTAIKVVLDDWIAVWDSSPEVASLRLLNFILCLAGIEEGLDRAGLEHHDPASCLAALQNEWKTVKTFGESLLSPKNKSKSAKATKTNFRDFWCRWAALVGSVIDTELATKFVLGWLMTMSSSGYRPLRHAASLACFSILRGCCQACSGLAKELDQATRLAETKISESINGAGLVDEVSSQLATLERIIQMTFDGVFVQRFRDIDPLIRSEAVESLAKWVLAYPDVFLDNSYLRYIGWALSDRIPSVRLVALEAIQELYLEGPTTREGMTLFIQRFLPRTIQMAERDIEMDIRNSACTLLCTMYRFALDQDEREDLSSQLSFILDLLKFAQPLTKENLDLLIRFIFRGQSLEEFRVVSESARQKIKNPQSSDQQPDIPVAHFIALFLEDLLQEVPRERRAFCVEHFVCHAKRLIPALRDLSLWLTYLQHVVLPGGPSRTRGKDREDWDLLIFAKTCSPSAVLHVIQAVARYSFVFVNSVADVSRQMKAGNGGMNSMTSRDLADVIAPLFNEIWSRLEPVCDAEAMTPLLDLLALAKAGPLADAWPEMVSNTLALINACNDEPSAMALGRLLRYWAAENIKGSTGALSQIILADSQRMHRVANTPIASIAWSEFAQDGGWARLAAVSTFLPLPDAVGIVSSIGKILEKLDVYLEEEAASGPSGILETLVVPGLLKTLANIILVTEAEDCFESCMTILHGFRRANYLRLELYCRIAGEKADLLHIGRGEEAELLEFALTAPSHPSSLFDLGRLYLSGIVSEETLISIFRHFQLSGVAGKCYSQLWKLVCEKRGEDIAKIIKMILKDHFALLSQLEESELQTAMGNTSSLAGMIELSLKKYPEARNTQLWMELHAECVESCLQTAPEHAQQIVGEFLDRVMSTFAHHLSSNIAVEVLAAVRKELAHHPEIEAPKYLKALEKACSARRGTPQRRAPHPPTTAASRLRQEVDPATDSAQSAGATSSEDEGMFAGVEHPITPLREMEGLRMSSEPALPSSPIQTRKRLLRP